MKVKAISKTNCPKCEWAKDQLRYYPVEWFNFDTDEEAGELAREYNLDATPAFLVFQDDGNVVAVRSVLAVKKLVDRNI